MPALRAGNHTATKERAAANAAVSAVKRSIPFYSIIFYCYVAALRAGNHTVAKDRAAANVAVVKIFAPLVPGPTMPLH